MGSVENEFDSEDEDIWEESEPRVRSQESQQAQVDLDMSLPKWSNVLLTTNHFERLQAYENAPHDQYYVRLPDAVRPMVESVVGGQEHTLDAYIPNATHPFFNTVPKKYTGEQYTIMAKVLRGEPISNEELLTLREWHFDTNKKSFSLRTLKATFKVDYGNGAIIFDILPVPQQDMLDETAFDGATNEDPNKTVRDLLKECNPSEITKEQFEQLSNELDRATQVDFSRLPRKNATVRVSDLNTVDVSVIVQRNASMIGDSAITLEAWQLYMWTICKHLIEGSTALPPEMIWDLYDGHATAVSADNEGIPRIKLTPKGHIKWLYSSKFRCKIPERDTGYICAFNQDVPASSEWHLEVQLVRRWLGDAAFQSLSTLSCMGKTLPVPKDTTFRKQNNMRLPTLHRGNVLQRQLFDERARAHEFKQKIGLKITAPDEDGIHFLPEDEIHGMILVQNDKTIPENLKTEFRSHTTPGSVEGTWYEYTGSIDGTSHKFFCEREDKLKKNLRVAASPSGELEIGRMQTIQVPADNKQWYSNIKKIRRMVGYNHTPKYDPPMGYNTKHLDPDTGYHKAETATPYVTGFEESKDMFDTTSGADFLPDMHIISRAILEVTLVLGNTYETSQSKTKLYLDQPPFSQPTIIPGDDELMKFRVDKQTSSKGNYSMAFTTNTNQKFTCTSEKLNEGELVKPLTNGEQLVKQVQRVAALIIKDIAAFEPDNHGEWIYKDSWIDFSIKNTDIPKWQNSRAHKTVHTILERLMRVELLANQKKIRAKAFAPSHIAFKAAVEPEEEANTLVREPPDPVRVGGLGSEPARQIGAEQSEPQAEPNPAINLPEGGGYVQFKWKRYGGDSESQAPPPLTQDVRTEFLRAGDTDHEILNESLNDRRFTDTLSTHYEPFYVKKYASSDKSETDWLSHRCTSSSLEEEVKKRLDDTLLQRGLGGKTFSKGELTAFVRFDTGQDPLEGGADNHVGFRVSCDAQGKLLSTTLDAKVILRVARRLPSCWLDPPNWWSEFVKGTNQKGLSDYFPIHRFPMMGDNNNGISIRHKTWKEYSNLLAIRNSMAPSGLPDGDGLAEVDPELKRILEMLAAPQDDLGGRPLNDGLMEESPAHEDEEYNSILQPEMSDEEYDSILREELELSSDEEMDSGSLSIREPRRLDDGNTLIKGHGDRGLGHQYEDVDWTGAHKTEGAKSHQQFIMPRDGEPRKNKPEVNFIAFNLTVFDKKKLEEAYRRADTAFHNFMEKHRFYRNSADDKNDDDFYFDMDEEEESYLRQRFPFSIPEYLPARMTEGTAATMDKSTVEDMYLATRPARRFWKSWMEDRIAFAESKESQDALEKKINKWEDKQFHNFMLYHMEYWLRVDGGEDVFPVQGDTAPTIYGPGETKPALAERPLVREPKSWNEDRELFASSPGQFKLTVEIWEHDFLLLIAKLVLDAIPTDDKKQQQNDLFEMLFMNLHLAYFMFSDTREQGKRNDALIKYHKKINKTGFPTEDQKVDDWGHDMGFDEATHWFAKCPYGRLTETYDVDRTALEAVMNTARLLNTKKIEKGSPEFNRSVRYASQLMERIATWEHGCGFSKLMREHHPYWLGADASSADETSTYKFSANPQYCTQPTPNREWDKLIDDIVDFFTDEGKLLNRISMFNQTALPGSPSVSDGSELSESPSLSASDEDDRSDGSDPGDSDTDEPELGAKGREEGSLGSNKRLRVQSSLVRGLPSIEEVEETMRVRFVLATRLSLLAARGAIDDGGGVAACVGHGREV